MVFTDFVVPDQMSLILGLAIGTLLVSVLIYAVRPPMTQSITIAIVPWIIAGAILHVFYQIHVGPGDGELFPEGIAPIFSAPSIYFTTFILLGLVWVLATMIVPSPDHDHQIGMYLGLTGVGVATPLAVLVVWQGLGDLELNLILPTLGLIASLAVTFLLFILIGIWRTYVIAETRYVGALVLFAHVFDAITTAIGVELMDAHERSSLPRMIMDFAADLPTYDILGEAWLFVVIKLVLASAIVVFFADYLYEKPAEGNLFFAIVIAVGLGPAVNNFCLFVLGM